MNNRTCLLLIDWQEGFRDECIWGPRNNPQAEDNAKRLIDAWRIRGMPLFHVRHASREPGSPLAADQPGHAFRDFATPAPSEPEYVKTVHAAFIGTTMEQDLHRAGVNALIISGVATDHCVSTTARMAHDLGFSVTIAGDACHAFARQAPNGILMDAETVHNVALASLHGEFGRVLNVDDILAGLAG